MGCSLRGSRCLFWCWPGARLRFPRVRIAGGRQMALSSDALQGLALAGWRLFRPGRAFVPACGLF
eukprot:6678559-Alexandrium_andersonii.AAC.1